MQAARRRSQPAVRPVRRVRHRPQISHDHTRSKQTTQLRRNFKYHSNSVRPLFTIDRTNVGLCQRLASRSRFPIGLRAGNDGGSHFPQNQPARRTAAGAAAVVVLLLLTVWLWLWIESSLDRSSRTLKKECCMHAPAGSLQTSTLQPAAHESEGAILDIDRVGMQVPAMHLAMHTESQRNRGAQETAHGAQAMGLAAGHLS